MQKTYQKCINEIIEFSISIKGVEYNDKDYEMKVDKLRTMSMRELEEQWDKRE